MNAADDDSLPPGYQLGSYRIRRKLGRGGFGITYLADDLELNAIVAIKEYLPSIFARRGGGAAVVPLHNGVAQDFEKYRQQFRNEAQTLAAFDHPNIVRVRRLLEANNTTYYVMDYVEGQTLEDACRSMGRLPGQAALLLMEKLLDGLKIVHEKNLIHRDIKPDNILLARIAEAPATRLPGISPDVLLRFGRPVLIDFGAARAVDFDDKSMTGIMSPGYSPPEQASRRAQHDRRSDVYALAATIYRCLSGERPPASTDRMLDPSSLRPAAHAFAGMAPASFLHGLDQGLALRMQDRPGDVAAWRAGLFADFRITEWSSPVDYGRGGEGGTGAPGPAPQPSYPPQSYPPQSYPPQSYPPQSYPPQSYPPGSHPPGVFPSAPYPSGAPSPGLGVPPSYGSGSAPPQTPTGGGGMALALLGGLLVLGGLGGGAYWYLTGPGAGGSGAPPVEQAGGSIDIDDTAWTQVPLARYGIRSGNYALSADGPFRVRVNGQVFTIDGEGGVDLRDQPSVEVHLKSTQGGRRVTLTPAGDPG